MNKIWLTAKKIGAFMPLLVLVACNSAPSPEATTALETLQKLNAHIEVGINKTEYSREITDVKFAVEKFQRTDDAKKRVEFEQHLESALEGHLVALQIWQKCDNPSGSFETTYYCTRQVEELASVLQQYLNNRAKQTTQSKLVAGVDTSSLAEKIVYDTNGVLQEVWKHTQEDINKAASTLK